MKPGQPAYVEYNLPEEASGIGIVEGSRGALGHWIEIKNKKIANYQAVVPTTWNMSPMDDKGQHGAAEQALIGTKVKDEKNPFEIVRIIRSFDPCLACAIHFVTPKGRDLGQYRIVYKGGKMLYSEQKNFDEIIAYLEKDKGIFIIGCDGCASLPAAAGRNKLKK